MADFNQQVQKTADPNFLGASEAPSRFDYHNDTWGGVLEGAGNVIGGAARAVDSNNLFNIKQDVYKGVDALRNLQGVQVAVNGVDQNGQAPDFEKVADMPSPGNIPGNRPPNLDNISTQMSRLSTANQAGKIGDTQYYAQLEALSRQVRTQYPGYRDQIDEMIKQTTGITPANALRSSILSDITSGQTEADKTKKEYQTFWNQHMGDFTPDQRARYANGSPPPLLELQATAGNRAAVRADLDDKKLQLSVADSIGKATSQDAVGVATDFVNQSKNRMFQDLGSVGGLMQKLQDAQTKGTALSPSDLNAVKGQFMGLKSKFEQQLNQYLDTPGASGRSISAIMDSQSQGASQKFKQDQMASFDGVEKAITDNNFGVVKIAANTATAMMDKRAAEVLKGSDPLQTMAALGSLPGAGPWIASVAAGNPELTKSLTGAVNQSFRTSRADPNHPNDTPDTHVLQLQKLGNAAPGSQNAYINGLVDDLSNPTYPKEIAAENARKLFKASPYFLQNYTSADQATVFARLTSPAVTKRMLDLGGEEAQAYRDWAKNSMGTVFKSVIDTVNDTPNRAWIDTSWDSKANQWKVTPTAEGLKAAQANGFNSTNPLSWIEQWKGSNVKDSVDKLNLAIKNIEPILKADGYDVSKEMQSFMYQSGIHPTGAKNDTFFQSLRNSIDTAQTTKPSTADEMNQAFGGTHLSFQDAPGGNRGGIDLTDKNFGRFPVPPSSNGETMTKDNWSLHFYKPTDLMAPTSGGQFVDANAARMADTLGARFYAATGIKVPVNDSRAYSGGSTAGLRRGTADPSDNPHVSASQHLLGKAFDFQIQKLTDQQKQTFLQMAHEIGFGGVGFYEGSSGHLHLDTGRMRTWGATPAWAGPLGSHSRVEAPPGSLKAYGMGQE